MKEINLKIVKEMIIKECDDIKLLLLEKNKKYGNSALQPKRIFSKQNSVEQIKVRIDDKLSRIQTTGISLNDSKESEDVTKDLIGYLVLLRIAQKIY